MSTALHSFIDIFDTEFGEGQDAVQLKKRDRRKFCVIDNV